MAAIYVNNIMSQCDRKKRSKWVKNWLSEKERLKYNHVPLLRELAENDPSDFRNYLRMDETTFIKLFNLLKVHLTKQDTRMRTSISAEERLFTTLRFLATGRSYADLKFSVGIAAQTLGYLIPETCRVIYNVLKDDYLKVRKHIVIW